MELFAKLVSILGLDGDGAPADWDSLTDEVLSTAIGALASTADVKAAHALLAEAYGAAKSGLGDEPTAAAVASVARAAQVAEMLRADHAARTEAAATAKDLPEIDGIVDADVPVDPPADGKSEDEGDKLPDSPKLDADTTVKDGTGKVQASVKAGGTVAPVVTPTKGLDDLKPIVTTQFMDSEGMPLPMGEIELADEGKVLLAAAAQGSAPGAKQVALMVPYRVTTNTTTALAAAAADCGIVATACEFPLLVDEQRVCGTADRPEAGAFVTAPAGWNGTQSVVFRPNLKLTFDDAQTWTQQDYAKLFVGATDPISGQWVPMQPLEFKPDVELSDFEKQCLKWECADAYSFPSEADYICLDAIPVGASATVLTNYRALLMMQIMRRRSRRTLSFLAGKAKWRNMILAPNAQDERNRLGVWLDNLVTAIAEWRANAKTSDAIDVWLPSWIMNYLVSENVYRDSPFAQGEFSVLVSALASVGATPRLSYDGFDTDTSAKLAALFPGASNWYLQEPQAAGVTLDQAIGLPPFPGPVPVPALDPLPTVIPVMLTEAGSVIEQSKELISIGFTGDINQQPLGKGELTQNCRTMFAEAQVFRAIRGCYDPVGLVICSDPRGATYDNVALPNSTCGAPF